MKISFGVDSVQCDDEFEVNSDAVPRVGDFVGNESCQYRVKAVYYHVIDGNLEAGVLTDKIYDL